MKTVRFLFNDAMARAIVDGRKTVTRRPVNWARLPHGTMGSLPDGRPWPYWEDHYGDYHPASDFGATGDLLIGRECWRIWQVPMTTGSVAVEYRSDGATIEHRGHSFIGGGVAVDCAHDLIDYAQDHARWRPSIHMPDAAARIRRRVVSVTVERVRWISNTDAAREGFSPNEVIAGETATELFLRAWDRIYSAKGLGWDVNPWVWRIEFSAEDVAQDVAP